MFHARPTGLTFGRGREDRAAVAALHSPHPGDDRFDPDFRISMQCGRCGKFAYGPRRSRREAMEEHWRETCPARHTKADAPLEARITYPKQ